MGPERFRFLASVVAGRHVDVAAAADGQSAHTDGQVIFVSADRSADHQRREVLVQSALLGAGSFDRRHLRHLRGRPAVARRYLALEGRRVLVDLVPRLPLAAAVCEGDARTCSAEESLDIASSRTSIAAAPEWFGTIRPSVLMRAPTPAGSSAAEGGPRLTFDPADAAGVDEGDEDDEPSGKSRILRLFELPVGAQAPARFLRALFGSSRSPGSDGAGGELSVGSIRRASATGGAARPSPTPIVFTGDERSGSALGVRGARYPEWDVYGNRYREDWCRVVDFPVITGADVPGAGVLCDAVLRQRLSRVGLGPRALRARPDGDDVDTEALVNLAVDLRSGHSPDEHVYTERRRVARNLGVLVLLDASGSATDADLEGLAVHEHQRRAAATLAATLEELGDRVAVYGFRSHGRNAVHLPAIKTFGQRFGALSRARLDHLQPAGYTRLGAGIRGAAAILQRDSGTPNRLLLVLSDGHPYDDGYEDRYAEADVRRALDELRADGMGCLCLSIGAATDGESLRRVFGPASHAHAATLAALSPRMDELFVSALQELAAPRARR
ncbi:nitric oxide reductase activation protein NorD [Mycolicibacterium sediminis]|uniref:VWFA domain-containing protein n=1 Tax=Mycolicibacterium sediminis TaxID=1286180 RepID=A0A7I7QYH6_9MYCO|nr:VWA domain-containing protein [Mycolicibacterium sediminis]BBY30976.1 hypothetical protein MSEDJ_50720 [Mycolicibacterium sediminis]